MARPASMTVGCAATGPGTGPRWGAVLASLAIAAVAGCGGAAGTSIAIAFREPSTPELLAGVDTFVLSIEDGRGQPLVLRRFGATAPLHLDDVPFGAQLVFSLEGLFHDTAIVAGRTCAVDVLAGQPLPHVSMFLAPTGSFNPTAPPSVPVRNSLLAIPRQDGRVVIAGGLTDDGTFTSSTSSVEQYDASTGLWAMDHDLPVARAGAVWAPLPGGALVVGGTGADGNPVGELDRYDEMTGFHVLPPALPLTATAVAALSDGSVLIAGGAAAEGVPVSAAWLYDQTGLEPVAGGLIVARQAHTLSVVGTGNFSEAFAIGGSGVDGAPLATIELYDPRGGSTAAAFRSTTSVLAHPRAGHTATVLATGEILIVGGQDVTGAPVLAAEIFDPITGAVRPAGSLAQGRVGHTATLLGDGRVLIAGGQAAAMPLASVEIFDPALGNFVAARSLGTARATHAAVTLCDGTVLIAGGGAGAEIYNPTR